MSSISEEKIPLIAVVGRPNVGKSTLFNRLTGRWQSIVEDRPGITRDRLYGSCEILGHKFNIVDTGGLEDKPKSAVEKKMSAQAEKGIEEADVIFFVMDGRAGLMPADEDWIRKLRKIRKPVLFLVNKIDETALDNRLDAFEGRGLKPLIPLSAENQRNFGGLTDAISEIFGWKEQTPFTAKQKQSHKVDKLAKEEDLKNAVAEVIDPRTRPLSVAIIGRPNVGKSTLLNGILGEERSVVDDVPGTTRDPILVEHFEYNKLPYRLVDTAGIRKRARTEERVEKFSVVAALKAIDEADVTLLVIDGAIGPTEQDAHVAGYAFEKNRTIILIVNKWDLAGKEKTREEFVEKLELKMNYLRTCPTLYISAKTGKNIDKIFSSLEKIRDETFRRVSTGELNRAFEDMVTHHPLPTYKGRDIKMYYATQTGVNPPRFLVFCSAPEHVHFSYKRYLLNSLKEIFKYESVPVVVNFRSKKKK